MLDLLFEHELLSKVGLLSADFVDLGTVVPGEDMPGFCIADFWQVLYLHQ